MSRLLLFTALVLAVAVCLGWLGAAHPLLFVLRLLAGGVLVFFLPGVFILRSLRVHRQAPARTLIYTIALSLAFDMLLGLGANFCLPRWGVAQPLSLLPLGVAYAGAVLLLAGVACWRDRQAGSPLQLRWDIPALPQFLFLAALPVLAVLGAALVNVQGSNVLLMLLIPLIGLVVVLALGRRWLPEALYPWALFCCAVALVLHFTLISSYLNGRDITVEYLIYQFTATASCWTPSFPANGYNATLSITILPLLISRLTGLDGLYVFKVVIPVIFALTPLIMYEILKSYLPPRVSLVVSFVPLCMYQFYTVMPQTVKTEMGWLFVTAALLAYLDRRQATASRVLAVAFFLAAVVSHYYSSYLACYLLLAGAVVMFFRKRAQAFDLLNTALMVLAATLVWYAATGGGANLNVAVWVSRDFLQALLTGFTTQTGAYGINLLGREELSPARFVLKYLYLASYALVALGFLPLLWQWGRRQASQFPSQFIAFAAASFGLLVSVVVPGAAASVDINRSFSLSMLFLAPFIFVAFCYGAAVIKTLPSLRRGPGQLARIFGASPLGGTPWPWQKLALAGAASLAVLFLIFGSGWASEMEGDNYPLSPSLSRAQVFFAVYDAAEMDGARWLTTHRLGETPIYYDDAAQMAVASATPLSQLSRLMYGAGQRFVVLEGEMTPLPPRSYIYLRAINLRAAAVTVVEASDKLIAPPHIRPFSDLPALERALQDADIIFDNGGSQVRLTR